MRILAIETATPAASVVLLDVPDPTMVGERMLASGLDAGGALDSALAGEIAADVPQRHLEWLAPAIAALLAGAGWRPADVQGVGVSIGPGSFTGLRIGIATAAAWAHARHIPVVGVSTLEALALGTATATLRPGSGPDNAHVICPVLDARKGDLAFALFEGRPRPRRLIADMVAPAAALLERLPQDRPVTFTGDGVPHLPDAVRSRPRTQIAPERQWSPRARFVGAAALARLAHGDHDDPYLLRPIYARGAAMTRPHGSGGVYGAEGKSARSGGTVES